MQVRQSVLRASIARVGQRYNSSPFGFLQISVVQEARDQAVGGAILLHVAIAYAHVRFVAGSHPVQIFS